MKVVVVGATGNVGTSVVEAAIGREELGGDLQGLIVRGVGHG